MGGFTGRRAGALMAAVAAATILGITSAPAGAVPISVPSSGGVRHLTVVDSTPDAWRAPLANAVGDWDAAPQLSFAITAGATDASNGTCPATAGTIRICARNYSPDIRSTSNQPGVDIRRNLDGQGHVISVSVRIDTSVLNAPYHPTPPYTDGVVLDHWGGRREFVCDAIGEALGVGANGGQKSCTNVYARDMVGTYKANYLRPQSNDYAAIATLYR